MKFLKSEVENGFLTVHPDLKNWRISKDSGQIAAKYFSVLDEEKRFGWESCLLG